MNPCVTPSYASLNSYLSRTCSFYDGSFVRKPISNLYANQISYFSGAILGNSARSLSCAIIAISETGLPLRHIAHDLAPL